VDRFWPTEAQQVITEGGTLNKWTRNPDGSWSGRLGTRYIVAQIADSVRVELLPSSAAVRSR
jgi:hypothetical protein